MRMGAGVGMRVRREWEWECEQEWEWEWEENGNGNRSGNENEKRMGMRASEIENGNIVNCLKLFCELSFQNVSSLLTNHVSPNFDYK